MFRLKQSGEIKYGCALNFFRQIFLHRQMKNKLSPFKGFTLTELLMALMISAVLLVILGRFLTNFHQSRESSKVMMELQEQAQFAMDFMINGYNRTENQEPSANPRFGGIIWASTYDLNDSGKKISFDYMSSSNKEISYEQRDDGKLYHTFPDEGEIKEKVIIPYLEGSHTYQRGPYNVEVTFREGTGDSIVDPNMAVSIDLKISKDELTFESRSTVTLRNY